MILSSADILEILGRNEIIRLSATLSIVDGKPALTGAEGIRIYVDRFPRVDEFQATWFIYIESDEDVDLIVAELKRLLPSVRVSSGLLTTITTTDFLSESTQRAPEAPKPQATQVDLTQYEERFQELVEDVQDRMLLINSGRPGKDGKDGLPGAPGRDGKDIDATETELFDLKDVGQSILSLEKGQVLTFDGVRWTNLHVRQVMSAGGAIGGGSTNEPDDGLGGVVSSFWKFDESETEQYSDGKFSVNSHQGKTDWSLATEVYLGYKNNAGNNTKNYILQLVKTGQYLYIQRNDNPDAYVILEVLANPVDADAKGARIEVAFVSQGTQVSEIKKDKVCGLTFTLIAGGGGGGVSELNDLTDVTIDPALLDKDFGLVYDGSAWGVGSPPVLIEGHNQSGATLFKGTPVYVAGTHSSGKPLFEAADADGAGTYPAIGLLHEDLANGVDGHVMLSGLVTNVDTSPYAAGDALYLSTTSGSLTNVRPTAATEKVQKVGIVTRVHATAGSILIIGAGRTNDINNELVALIGAGDKDAVDLGTFSGTTISDNNDVKGALQELETAVEAGGGGIPEAPLDGNYYVRQSGGWVPNTNAPTDISNNTLNELSDVSNLTPSAGDALIFNGTDWAPGGDLHGGSF